MTLVLLGAGNSSRFGLNVKKQWLWCGNEPLWLYVTNRFTHSFSFHDVVITAHPKEIPFYKKYCHYTVVEGADTRQRSLLNALEMVQTPYVLVSDIARPCIQKEVVQKMIENRSHAACIVPYIQPADTVVYKNETIDRNEVKLIQTPQLSKTDILRKALTQGKEFTDESSAIASLEEKVLYIPGDRKQHKLTYTEDLKLLPCLQKPSNAKRIGNGFDVHAFCANRKLFLCGIEIPYDKGLAGHSDADVAIHALIDALLGAAGFGDIGELFPDSVDTYKDIDSKKLLFEAVQLLHACGFVIENVDLTIIAQNPKIGPYKAKMQQSLHDLLHIPQHAINLKATTTEHLGFVGRNEGIAAMATATLHYFDWSAI